MKNLTEIANHIADTSKASLPNSSFVAQETYDDFQQRSNRLQEWQASRNNIPYVLGERMAESLNSASAALKNLKIDLFAIYYDLQAKIAQLFEATESLTGYDPLRLPSVAAEAVPNSPIYPVTPHQGKGGKKIKSLSEVRESEIVPFLSGVFFDSSSLGYSKIVEVEGKKYVLKALEGSVAALHEEILRKIGLNNNLPELHQVSVEIRPYNRHNLLPKKAPPLVDCIGYMREMIPFRSLQDEAVEKAEEILRQNDWKIPLELEADYEEFIKDYHIPSVADEHAMLVNFLSETLALKEASELFARHLQKILRANLLGTLESNPQNIFRDPTSAEGFSFPDVGYLVTSTIQGLESAGYQYVTPKDYFDLYEYTLSDEYKNLRDRKLNFIQNIQAERENSELYKFHAEAFKESEENLAKCYEEFYNKEFSDEEFWESFYNNLFTTKVHGNGEVVNLEYDINGKLTGDIDIVDTRAVEEFQNIDNEEDRLRFEEARQAFEEGAKNVEDHFYFSDRKKFLGSASTSIRGASAERLYSRSKEEEREL